MSNKNSDFVKNILERYKDIHNLRKWDQVADRIGVSSSTLSTWKTRNSISGLDQIINSCDDDVNLNWLLKGEGEPKIDERVQAVEDKFSDYAVSINDLSKSDIARDDLLEFLLKQQETVLDFLHRLKGDRTDD